MGQFSRVQAILNQDQYDRLRRITVVVVGVGGVGSAAVEALVRSGVVSLYLIDPEKYEPSNLNRQWPSRQRDIGRYKVEVVAEECRAISPDCHVDVFPECLTTENIDKLIGPLRSKKNVCFIDAVDDLKVKTDLIAYLYDHHAMFISSMGAANLQSAEGITVTDISKTTYCPLSKKIRQALKKKGIYKGIPVVYSPIQRPQNIQGKGSIMPVTAAFGLRLAEWVLTPPYSIQ